MLLLLYCTAVYNQTFVEVKMCATNGRRLWCTLNFVKFTQVHCVSIFYSIRHIGSIYTCFSRATRVDGMQTYGREEHVAGGRGQKSKTMEDVTEAPYANYSIVARKGSGSESKGEG